LRGCFDSEEEVESVEDETAVWEEARVWRGMRGDCERVGLRREGSRMSREKNDIQPASRGGKATS
jgi:hypothetical protein